MFIYSTCRDCGQRLHVTHDDTVHPGCTPRPTRLEQLTEDYLAAVQMGDQPALERDLETAIKELESAPPRLAEAAITYATWGWPVFPLLADGEVNARTGEVSDGKKPATMHGFKDATNDVGRIAQWWRAHPHHNIGLPTGHAFDVIDVDLPDGPVAFDRLLADVDPDTGIGSLPDCHGWAMTSGGGWHLYIVPTGDINGTGILPGIDYRGLGGYVVAPPSALNSGAAWRWKHKPSPVIRGAR